jgi:hypothetical protein
MLSLLAIREINVETSKIALKLQIGFEVNKRVWMLNWSLKRFKLYKRSVVRMFE